jgi:demethylmenaquinone methyltransferase/2-methoxy-6-polyprenyl-1,4-benzoquinol methylase
MSAPLPHDAIKPFSNSGKGKKEQVAEMFDRIARRYDFMNRFLSLRVDLYWRKKAINRLKKNNPQRVLDVATGTGDLALMANQILNPQKITGIDISAGMLEIGRQKIAQQGLSNSIELLQCDAETINFTDNSFDAVMVAFGVRNFENLEAGLKEMQRVLKPGGQLMVLEFSRPRLPLFRTLYDWYMKKLAPALAGSFNTDKEAYAYLNRSANAFPDRENFTSLLESAGFIQTSFEPLTLGICCIYTAKKSQ